MKLNDENKHLLIIIIATSIVVSSFILMQKTNQKDDLYNIPEDILDQKYPGPNKVIISLDKKLSETERVEMQNLMDGVISQELLDKINDPAKIRHKRFN